MTRPLLLAICAALAFGGALGGLLAPRRPKLALWSVLLTPIWVFLLVRVFEYYGPTAPDGGLGNKSVAGDALMAIVWSIYILPAALAGYALGRVIA